MTPAQLEQLAAQGRYWWQTAAGDYYATAEKAPADPADVYLLDASPQWVAQWNGNWQHAADQINGQQED